MSKIERSTGHVIPGSMGMVAGGGHTGASESLDATVARAAELLSDAFDRDVEIRFNSDRRSGGAWLKHDTGHWLTSNSQVSIGAREVTQALIDSMHRRYPNPEDSYMVDDLPEPGIYIDLGIAGAVLKEGADVSSMRHAQGLDGKDKFWGSADSVEEALSILIECVDPTLLP